MGRFILFLVVFFFSLSPLSAKKIQHRFIASDESGQQIIYVDEAKPKKNWQAPIKCRDMQLIGKKQLLVNSAKGYKILSITKKGKIVKEFQATGFQSVSSVRRMADGKTYLAGKGSSHPVIIQVLNKKNKLIKTINVDSKIKDVRLMRRTAQGTFFLGFGEFIYELNEEGAIIWQQKIAGGRHIYKAVRTQKGDVYVASGYGSSVHQISKSGKTIRELGKKAGQNLRHPDFFADFQILKNEHVVVANWMGHGRHDSKKGQQLAEYDKKGDLLWSWHDPEMAGCLHAVIILDKLNTKKLHTEENGRLAPAKTRK